MVYPSGELLATNSTPMVPAAPARFSTTTGWPNACVSRSAAKRAVMSFEPPGAKGTIHRIGFEGHPWASDELAATASSRAGTTWKATAGMGTILALSGHNTGSACLVQLPVGLKVQIDDAKTIPSGH